MYIYIYIYTYIHIYMRNYVYKKKKNRWTPICLVTNQHTYLGVCIYMCVYVYIMGNHKILNIINLRYAIRYSNMAGGSIRTGISSAPDIADFPNLHSFTGGSWWNHQSTITKCWVQCGLTDGFSLTASVSSFMVCYVPWNKIWQANTVFG